MVDKKQFLWWVIYLKLKETLKSSIPPSSPNSGTGSIEFPQQKNLQQEPSESLQVVINKDGENLQEEATSAASEWVISIVEKLELARQDNVPYSWAKLSIYKIPCYLRDSGGDDKAFAPQIVSLGPYHHGKNNLRQMERHKWRSINHVLKRTKHDIRLYLNSMKEMEERARSCYEGPISLSSNEFVEMLVLDGCFVIELFRGAEEGFEKLGYSSNDPVFAMRGSIRSIQKDMIMLENQLPLFVLDRLLGIQLGKPNRTGRIVSLALRFLHPLMPTNEPSTSRRKFDPLPDQPGLHCLDVFRRSLLWIEFRSHACPHTFADVGCQQLIRCVTELREAGVRFKKRNTDRFWAIEFKDGILWIPRLLIHDGTKSLLLNLIAFEQCHLDFSNHIITSYVIFMDNLINSPEDVGYLHYRGIIEHWLGSDDDVANLFNRLCQAVVLSINDSYLSSLSEAVNKHCSDKRNTWCAILRHNYFNNPWAIISLVAAAVLLLLTFAQTYYSIYGYYRPAQ